MSAINVLPKNIADLIAAGEVVERPSSVVKELCENALDADATSIVVEINNGGKTYIRVTDNGRGIRKADVKKAFMSHATSKISNAADLDAIKTLGFRGEALPSIAAVSSVDVLTRTGKEHIGARFVIEGGDEIVFDDAGCPPGTTVSVRNLFYNVPARMKFLKKDVSEGNAVGAVCQKLAISHPEIAVRFIRDGKVAFRTAGDGNLENVLASLFGREIRNTMTKVEYTAGGISVKGLVSLPHHSKGSRASQFFFINGRTIKSPVILSALEGAYKNSITAGKFPAAALFIEIPFELVDVNVHPSKTEVRFQDDKRVFDCVYYGVKNAISEERSIKASFSPAAAFIKPDTYEEQVKMGASQFTVTKVYGAPVTKSEDILESPNSKEPIQNEMPIEINIEETSADTVQIDENPIIERDFSDLHILGEVYGVYVLIKYGDAFFIADKHAAHERIIFNSLKESKQDKMSQILMQSVMVTLSGEEHAAITENLPLLLDAGYEITDFGEMSVAVKSCPSSLLSEDIESVISEIASRLAAGEKEPIPEKLDWIYHSTACRAAVKSGDRLGDAELYELMKKVFSDNSVRYCPHGRPVVVEITRKELEKLFMRTG